LSHTFYELVVVYANIVVIIPVYVCLYGYYMIHIQLFFKPLQIAHG